jgi:hypothetical protein
MTVMTATKTLIASAVGVLFSTSGTVAALSTHHSPSTTVRTGADDGSGKDDGTNAGNDDGHEHEDGHTTTTRKKRPKPTTTQPTVIIIPPPPPPTFPTTRPSVPTTASTAATTTIPATTPTTKPATTTTTAATTTTPAPTTTMAPPTTTKAPPTTTTTVAPTTTMAPTTTAAPAQPIVLAAVNVTNSKLVDITSLEGPGAVISTKNRGFIATATVTNTTGASQTLTINFAATAAAGFPGFFEAKDYTAAHPFKCTAGDPNNSAYYDLSTTSATFSCVGTLAASTSSLITISSGSMIASGAANTNYSIVATPSIGTAKTLSGKFV